MKTKNVFLALTALAVMSGCATKKATEVTEESDEGVVPYTKGTSGFKDSHWRLITKDGFITAATATINDKREITLQNEVSHTEYQCRAAYIARDVADEEVFSVAIPDTSYGRIKYYDITLAPKGDPVRFSGYSIKFGPEIGGYSAAYQCAPWESDWVKSTKHPGIHFSYNQGNRYLSVLNPTDRILTCSVFRKTASNPKTLVRSNVIALPGKFANGILYNYDLENSVYTICDW